MSITKEKKNITEELGNGRILPLIARLSIPAVIAQLITFLYNIVDRMYVAQIEDSGMDALAALGIVLPITLIIQAFANLIGLGGAPRAGIKMGEGNNAEAGDIFNTAFSLLVLIGVVIGAVSFVFARQIVLLFGCPPSAVEFAVSYLKIYACGTLFVMLAQGLNPFILTQGYSLVAMGSVLLGAVINIALDPIFIFALGMGVSGSSLATVISQLCSCICVMCFFFTRKSLFHLRPSAMCPRLRYIGAILSLGFTPFVMTITECAIQVVFNVCLNRATGGDRDYTAALTVMLSALQLISLPLNGLGNGIQPFVSYNYGKGDEVRLKKGIRFVTVIAFVFCLTIWSLSMAMPQIYAHLFSASESVTEIVGKYCPLFLMGSIMFFVQMTLQNVNVALGQARSALLLAVTRKVVILIPLCFFLTHVLGFRGVYMSEGIADFAAGIITSIVIFTSFPRIFHRRAMQMRGETEK
ncbi:MAG: MATE family efflux transporter [Oscillospiraceae bacterium]|nr:MAG: MATE family efflux transporter [Oscillospiraceae bacterium]